MPGGAERRRRRCACPPPSPPSRTKWTRLVHPSVLIGHVSRGRGRVMRRRWGLGRCPGGRAAARQRTARGPERRPRYLRTKDVLVICAAGGGRRAVGSSARGGASLAWLGALHSPLSAVAPQDARREWRAGRGRNAPIFIRISPGSRMPSELLPGHTCRATPMSCGSGVLSAGTAAGQNSRVLSRCSPGTRQCRRPEAQAGRLRNAVCAMCKG